MIARRPSARLVPPLLLDEMQSSAPPPTSRRLSAEVHVYPHTTHLRELASQTTKGRPRCDRARAAQQGAYGHKPGCELISFRGPDAGARYGPISDRSIAVESRVKWPS